ncbi:MAG: SpaA isopeptide-forming pilin-related protein [bacterium]|nr:SpaA isopeptide-forming pilin-related protein [bacterium]
MKKRKILKTLLLVISLFGIFNFISPSRVNAEVMGTLVQEKIPDVWYTRRGGGQAYASAQYTTYTMDGRTVYCIQPGVPIDTSSYIGHDGLVASPYDEKTNKLIELIGHYGYDYPGHQTIRYRMAAQALIWETVGGQIIEYWTEASGWGDYINVDAERNEIMRLVNAHYNKPSFNGQSVDAVVGKEIAITDTNGLLGEYEVYKSTDFSVRLDGNTIYATPLKTGELQLNVVRKHYDNFTTIVFLGNGVTSQNMGYFRFSDPVMASVKVHSVGGDVAINKLDNDSQTNIPSGVDSSLKGAVYGVYNYSDTLITSITTDENGNAKTPTMLELGDYYLKEITASKGYNLDTNKYYFTIKEDSLHPTIKVYEQIIKRDVELLKFFASAETGILTPEENITFEIYDSKNNLVKTLTTDSQGFIKTELVYGTYTIKQVNTTSGHEKIKDFKIVVNDNSPKVIRYSLSNAEITAKLKLIKIDKESGLVIPYSNVSFKIKNVDTKEYIYQKVTYPKKQTICEFATDENGIFITPYPLNSGTYEIEEISSPKGYLLSKDHLTFRIDEDSKIIEDEDYGKYVEVSFANQVIKGEIHIEKLGELFKVNDNTFKYELINLKGVELSLYADEDITTLDGVIHFHKGDLIKTITTDEYGKSSFTDLYLGKYIIKETKTLDNYVIDTKEYKVELKEIDNETPIVEETIEITNYLKKGTLTFTKTDLVDGTPIPNTLLEIRTLDGDVIFSGYTDDKGQIEIKDLSAGKYIIKEIQSADGYVNNFEEVEFEILEDGSVVKSEMKNKLITGTLHFKKQDISNDEPLPNTLIQIFNENDVLIYEGRTDENGEIVIEELKYGKYYILEKEAPEGYQLNPEKMYFEIKEDGEIVKATMVDEKVIIEVPNTLLDKTYVVEIIASALFMMGIGVVLYAIGKKDKKKNK